MIRGLIDWFSPTDDPSGPIDLVAGRRKKLVAFFLVLLAVTLISGSTQFIWGSLLVSLITLGFLAFTVAALLSLRWGAAPWLVTCVVVMCGMCVAAVLGVGAGENGIGSLFWIILAPLIALPIGGRRAGWITLLVAAVVIAVGLLGIEREWLTPLVFLESPFQTRLFSMLGVLFAAFLLSRAYEIETQSSITELQAKNEALKLAQTRADLANQAKSEFIATISHEIRTPLNGVTGMVSLLHGETDPQRLKEGLRVIQQSADTLLAVINDVLDFSKIDSNRLELERVPVSVPSELRMVLELFQSRAAEGSNELELEIDSSVPDWIQGDPTRLRQAAMNLVANAVKFTEQGRVHVSARVEGETMIIEVRDTGIGMSSLVQARLFEPFVQADTSTTRRFGGTGLGLVISRRLIEAMGGTLTLKSEASQGSSFYIKVPCHPVPGPPAQKAPSAIIPNACSVLVVEDNFVNQLVVSRLLERLGHRVVVANNGEEGLSCAQEETFDVVLMDCHMPVMDGFEAARRLRARGDSTPIYALTAAVSSEDGERCLQAGMTGVLTKPLQLDRLSEVLGRVARAQAAA